MKIVPKIVFRISADDASETAAGDQNYMYTRQEDPIQQKEFSLRPYLPPHFLQKFENGATTCPWTCSSLFSAV